MRPLVLKSVNEDAAGSLCVDLFDRRDGAPDPFGFETYRRDPEDGRWFPIGGHGARRFASSDAAWAAALTEVAWLAEAAA
ncbi:MAG: hypothetical protein AAF192_13595 [Pseudomonadota bacterium]